MKVWDNGRPCAVVRTVSKMMSQCPSLIPRDTWFSLSPYVTNHKHSWLSPGWSLGQSKSQITSLLRKGVMGSLQTWPYYPKYCNIYSPLWMYLDGFWLHFAFLLLNNPIRTWLQKVFGAQTTSTLDMLDALAVRVWDGWRFSLLSALELPDSC